MEAEPIDPAVRVRADEVVSIELLLREGRRDYALRSLDERGGAQELVRQQYSGRYPFELLQNANDAARERGTNGRARFVLTETALLVADNGSGFGEQQVQAICSLGRSSKGPGTSIGHKGLGFKSVGEITDRPQIVSTSTSFQFDAERLNADLGAIFGALPPRQRFPVYAFPYSVDPDDIGPDRDEIRELQADGFATIVRLPLRQGVEPATVASHLAENLQPRLLLFLPDVDHLELRGTDHDFSAEVARQDDGPVEHVLLETDQASEEWLIYRGSADPTTQVLQPMGDAWAEVQSVKFAVAVALDEHQQPRSSETFPLHVYFPTEERPGLHVAVHAEWALTMDRRRIADTPEAIEYNRFLLDAVTAFVATTVALDLVDRCDGAVASVEALVPPTHVVGDGASEGIVRRWRDALRDVAFLPFSDGELRRPIDAQLLPSTIPNPEAAHALANLPTDRTLRADVEAASNIRSFVDSLDEATSFGVEDFLSLMHAPTADTAGSFYAFLLGWRHAHGIALMEQLRAVRCVLTTNGQFLAPDEQTIFFPRRDSSVPENIPVPIAVVPEGEGFQGLFADLGVKDFEWRDLIREYLIKILERPDANADDRTSALEGLRAYQTVRRTGGEDVAALLGRVLLPARPSTGGDAELRRADSVYFGIDWTGSGSLEEIYGPFGNSEFLAVDVPNDPEEHRRELDFYRMLGVVDHPRLDQVADKYDIGRSRHPHAGAEFSAWLQAIGDTAQICPQGHGSAQKITLSHQLDRLNELALSEDPRRLLALWTELARHWGKTYADGMEATLRCDHGWHTGDPDRPVESLFGYLLRTRTWVPVQLGDAATVARPGEAWIETVEPPPRIRERIPRISEGMHRTYGGSALAASLGLIEAGRPKVENLLQLLESVADEADERGSINREISLAARWVQRTIDDVLPPAPEPHPVPATVRVLGSHQGAVSFVSQPPYADDPLLRDTWEQLRPVLSADTGLTRLPAYLGLVSLDETVKTTPIAYEEHHGSALESVRGRIDATKPYIFALVLAENSRAEARVRPALRRLEVVVCDRLVLKYEYDGDEVEREDATCYIATRQELRGNRRFNIGTAYLELDSKTGEPDWFAVGRQLSQHLDVVGHADAITMLLKMDKADRDRMMTDRQIPKTALADARNTLELALEDEMQSRNTLDELMSLPPSGGEFDDASVDDVAPLAEEATEDVAEADVAEPLAQTTASTPPPPIDWESVALVDATPTDVDARGIPSQRASPSIVRNSTAPTVQSEMAKAATGKRGEGIAYRKERDRVTAFGGDPGAVVWRSKNDETAPVDIISIDEGGDRIYIEVKSTSASDPSTPFDISRSELLEAGTHGDRYYVYRVTDTNTETPRITRWANPMKLIREQQGRLLLSGAQMELGLESPPAGSRT